MIRQKIVFDSAAAASGSSQACASSGTAAGTASFAYTVADTAGARSTPATVTVAVTPPLPNRRNAELFLLGFAAVITTLALLLVEANQEQGLHWDLAQYAVAYLALFTGAHLAVRRFAPYADPLLLPVVALLISLVQQRDQSLAAIVSGRPLFYLFFLAMLGLGLKYRVPAQRWLDKQFFRAEYSSAVDALRAATFERPEDRLQAEWFQAAATYSLYLVNGKRDQALLSRAEGHVRACRRIRASFVPAR